MHAGARAGLVGGLVATALTIANLEAFGFAAAGLLGGLGLVVAGVGVGSIVWGLARKRRRALLTGAAVVAGAVLAVIAAGLIGHVQENASRQRGDQVCSALEDYRQQRGEYPKHLTDLVPQFATEVSPTCMGVFRRMSFSYHRLPARGYTLGFDSLFFIAWYRGADGRWQCDD